MKPVLCFGDRDVICQKCNEFKLGMDNAKINLRYYDMTAMEFVDCIQKFLEYCESPSFKKEDTIRCISNTRKLCKTKDFKVLGLNNNVDMICVWNNHVMLIKDNYLTSSHWEYIVREVAGDLKNMKRPNHIPNYTWEKKKFGNNNIKLLKFF